MLLALISLCAAAAADPNKVLRVALPDVDTLDPQQATTVSAQRKLREGGVRERAGRAVVDQAAAVELLQHWLDARRS